MAFKFSIKDVDINILTSDELEQLQAKSLSIERINSVRDVFLFCCYVFVVI